MSRVDGASTNNTSSSGASQATDLRELDMDHFLQLLITELQNQDPLDPMENSEMLQQISQIREIGATDQLRESLESMQQSQGISTASSLIGKQVQALTDDGFVLFGVVQSVQITPGDEGTRQLTLKVDTGEAGTVDVKMEDIFNILPSRDTPPEEVPGEGDSDGETDGEGSSDGDDTSVEDDTTTST